MNPALKLDVFIGIPSYGGNGGISSEHPDIREWMCELLLKLKDDPRIGRVVTKTLSDTPVTMVRNQFVKLARQSQCHLLLMADSDQSPNKHRGEKWHKPFWDQAFDEVYKHYGKGPLVIGAPYCGPPNGGENVYVFYWDNDGSRGHETPYRLEQYPRMIAAKMTGIQECAALPTGMILYDMRCFDLIEPSKLSKDEVLDRFQEGKLSKAQAIAALGEGYFHYEWKDGYGDEKSSTEDVQNTRDISLAGIAKLGYNPVRCAWDSWVGHHKPWNVGKPVYYDQKDVAATFRAAVENQQDHGHSYVDVGTSSEWEKYINSKEVHVVQPPPESIHVTPEKHLNAIADVISAAVAIYDEPNVLEIGSWAGDSAKKILDSCPKANLVCVDTWEGCKSDHTGTLTKECYDRIFEQFKSKLSKYRRWASYRMTSDRFFESGYCPQKFHAVFIDGEHSYEQVCRDIKNSKEALRDGGLIVVHDYMTDQFPGVTKACDELLPGGNVIYRDVTGSIYAWSNQ